LTKIKLGKKSMMVLMPNGKLMRRRELMTRQLLRRKLEKMHGKRLIKNSKNSRNS
jgi:hypothetical protein